MIKVYFYFMDDEAVLTSNVFQNDKKKTWRCNNKIGFIMLCEVIASKVGSGNGLICPKFSLYEPPHISNQPNSG